MKFIPTYDNILVVGESNQILHETYEKNGISSMYFASSWQATNFLKKHHVSIVFLSNSLTDCKDPQNVVTNMLHYKPYVPIVLVDNPYILDRARLDDYSSMIDENLYCCILTGLPQSEEEILKITDELIDITSDFIAL